MQRTSVLLLGLAAAASVWLPPAFALLLGALVARVVGTPGWAGAAARHLLAVSIVAAGCGIEVDALLGVGLDGLVVTTVTLVLTFAVGLALGRAFGVPADTVVLVTAGTAICGGSAIAAIAPLVRARPHDVGAALGVVFALNALALVVFPQVGSALELDARQFGTWCALAIHDTSSVVGAAATHGQEALEVATITKLVRALWIVPVGAAIVWARRRDPGYTGRRVVVPGFLIGFVVAALLVASCPALQPLGATIADAARPGMTLALFCVGLGLSGAGLRRLGVRTLGFGVVLWVLLAVGCVAVVVAG